MSSSTTTVSMRLAWGTSFRTDRLDVFQHADGTGCLHTSPLAAIARLGRTSNVKPSTRACRCLRGPTRPRRELTERFRRRCVIVCSAHRVPGWPGRGAGGVRIRVAQRGAERRATGALCDLDSQRQDFTAWRGRARPQLTWTTRCRAAKGWCSSTPEGRADARDYLREHECGVSRSAECHPRCGGIRE